MGSQPYGPFNSTINGRTGNTPVPTPADELPHRIEPADDLISKDPTVTVMITTAPCCWGVDDVSNPNLPPWQRVFEEASSAGYGGLELGPYGYVPLQPGLVTSVLKQNDLFIVAGTIFDALVAEICALVTALPHPDPFPRQRFPGPYLTVMDWGHDKRDFAAGHSDRAPRLDDRVWQGMIENIKASADLARAKYGVRAVIHPHAGGSIEFSDEIARVANDVPSHIAGLCIDTGHTYYAGMDPVQTLQAYSDRIDHLHFKDIDEAVFTRVMGERIRFFEACAQGVMCPIGRGIIDYAAIRSFLDRSGYSGYITVEQERDPRNVGGSLNDVRASRDYLTTVGF